MQKLWLKIAVMVLLWFGQATQADVIYMPFDWHIHQVKAVIFDMDGVLRVGKNAIPGAGELVGWLEKKNIPSMILTNECRYTEKKIRQDLKTMGIPFPSQWKIYTAAHAMRDFFNEKIHLNQQTAHLFVIGENGLKSALSELNQQYFVLEEEFPENPSRQDQFFVVFGSVDQIKIQELEQAAKWIHRGAKVLTTCPDASDPASKGEKLIGMPGHMIHMIKMNAPCQFYSVGKPNQWTLSKALDWLESESPELQRQDILFIGDSMDTDMKVAFEDGLQTALVLSGNTQLNALAHQVVQPDIVVDSVKSLYQAILML